MTAGKYSTELPAGYRVNCMKNSNVTSLSPSLYIYIYMILCYSHLCTSIIVIIYEYRLLLLKSPQWASSCTYNRYWHYPSPRIFVYDFVLNPLCNQTLRVKIFIESSLNVYNCIFFLLASLLLFTFISDCCC